MRVDSKLVHSSISKATAEVVWSGGVGHDPKAMGAYQTQWFKEQGARSLIFLFVSTVVFGLSILGVKALDLERTVRALAVLALALLFATMLVVVAVRQARSLSVAQLGTLLPALDLTETQRAYVETLIALHGSNRPSSEADETLRVLNALLDEEARLVQMRGAVDHREPRDELARMEAERIELVAKLERASDSGARDAYAQSLSLLDERIAGLCAAEAGLERIDAHLELLRQAVLATRDAARRLAATPSAEPDLATDSLRATVALARAQTTETERALAELRTI